MLRKFVRITPVDYEAWRAEHGSQFAGIKAAGGIAENILQDPADPEAWIIELEMNDTANLARILSFFDGQEVPPPAGMSPLVASALVQVESNTF